MLRLAVTTKTETFRRMSQPLADRGIEATYIDTSQRALPLTDDTVFDSFDVGFVFPGRLMEGGAVDAHLSIPWLNDRSAILRSRNKAEVLVRLDRAGFSVPSTIMLSNPVDKSTVQSAFEQLESPALIKPNSTTRGVGITRINSVDELYGVTDYLDLIHEFPATDDRSYLIQEYIPNARDIRVMVLDGEYVGAVERTFPDTDDGRFVRNVHRGATAQAIDLKPELQRIAENVATELSIPFVGIDMLVTQNDAYITETNARPTIDTADKYVDGFYDQLAESIKRKAD